MQRLWDWDNEEKYIIKIPRLLQLAVFIDENENITDDINKAKLFEKEEQALGFLVAEGISEYDILHKFRVVKFDPNFKEGQDVEENMKVLMGGENETNTR